MDRGTETHPGGKKSADSGVPASYADARKKGGMGVRALNVSQSTASSTSSSSCFQVGMFFHILDQWRRLTSNRFVLNMV